MKSQENGVIKIDTRTYLAWLSCKKINKKITRLFIQSVILKDIYK